MKYYILGAIVVLFVLSAVSLLPELVRYLRIRSM